MYYYLLQSQILFDFGRTFFLLKNYPRYLSTLFTLLYVRLRVKLMSFQVLKIVCEIRKGPLSFSTCIVEALKKHFGSEIIGK